MPEHTLCHQPAGLHSPAMIPRQPYWGHPVVCPAPRRPSFLHLPALAFNLAFIFFSLFSLFFLVFSSSFASLSFLAISKSAVVCSLRTSSSMRRSRSYSRLRDALYAWIRRCRRQRTSPARW